MSSLPHLDRSSSSGGGGGMSGSKISSGGHSAAAKQQQQQQQRARNKSQAQQTTMGHSAGPVGSRLFASHTRSSSAAAPEVLFTSAGLVVRPALSSASAQASRVEREVRSLMDRRACRGESQTVVINGNVYETHSGGGGGAQRLPSSVHHPSRAQSSSFASHFASPSHTRSRTVGHGRMQPRQLNMHEQTHTTQDESEPSSYFGLGRSSSHAATASASSTSSFPASGDRVYSDSFAHPLLGGSPPVRLPPGRSFNLASAQRSVVTHYTERPDEITGSAGVDLRHETHTTIVGSAVHVAEQTEDRIAGVTRRAELRALGDRATAQVHTRSTSDQHGRWARDEQMLRNLPADEQSTERAAFERDWQDASAALSSATHLPSLMHATPTAAHAQRTFTHEVSSPTSRTVEQRSDSQTVHFDRQGHAHPAQTTAAVTSPSSSSPPVGSSPASSPQRSPVRSPMHAAASAASPTGSSPRSRSGTATVGSAPRTPTRAKGATTASGSGAAR